MFVVKGATTSQGAHVLIKQIRKFRFLGAALALAAPATSQQLGHYIQGATGIDGGSQPPSGFYATYLPYLFNVDSVRDRNGDKVLDADLRIAIQAVGLTYITKRKIFGATYGVSMLAPFTRQRLNSDILPSGGASTGYGFTDTLFVPAMLGWKKERMDVTASYGFYAPSGDFDPNKAVNVGLGFWEHQIQLGTTVRLDAAKTWSASLMTTWEINHTKAGVDLKPGPMMTAEYGIGKKLLMGGLKLGGSGYYYWKLIPDSGTAINPLRRGINDQAFAIGPEATLTLPLGAPYRLVSIIFKYQPQFFVKSRPQGQTFIVNLTFINLAH